MKSVLSAGMSDLVEKVAAALYPYCREDMAVDAARAAIEAMREAERPTLRNWCYFGSAGGGFLGTYTGDADQPWHFERLDRPA